MFANMAQFLHVLQRSLYKIATGVCAAGVRVLPKTVGPTLADPNWGTKKRTQLVGFKLGDPKEDPKWDPTSGTQFLGVLQESIGQDLWEDFRF